MEWAEQWFGFGFKAAERRTDRERERETVSRWHGGGTGIGNTVVLPASSRCVGSVGPSSRFFRVSSSSHASVSCLLGHGLPSSSCSTGVVVLTSQRWKKPPPPGVIACIPLQRARRRTTLSTHAGTGGGCEESRKPEGCFCDFYPQAQGQAVRVGASRRRRAPSSPIRLHVAHTTDRLVRVSVRFLFIFFCFCKKTSDNN